MQNNVPVSKGRTAKAIPLPVTVYLTVQHAVLLGGAVRLALNGRIRVKPVPHAKLAQLKLGCCKHDQHQRDSVSGVQPKAASWRVRWCRGTYAGNGSTTVRTHSTKATINHAYITAANQNCLTLPCKRCWKEMVKMPTLDCQRLTSTCSYSSSPGCRGFQTANASPYSMLLWWVLR